MYLQAFQHSYKHPWVCFAASGLLSLVYFSLLKGFPHLLVETKNADTILNNVSRVSSV